MATLERIESILGPRASVDVFIMIEEDYLGNEFDILDALMFRSDLVERAFTSILKDAGRMIFQAALNGTLPKIPYASTSNDIRSIIKY
jgi:hypothetical protein